ncbi:MAG: IS3 family transposase [bacterium]|nr:IS3 family transposase [bacterium]
MSRLRRSFDRGFRDGAVRIVKEAGRPVARVARELGVNEGTLGNWVRQDQAARSGGLSADERAELARLRKRVAESGDGARCPQTIRGRLGERGNAVTAGFIASQRTDHGVPHAVSLRALDAASSTFYKHLDRPLTQMQVRRRATDAEVKRAFDRSQGTYGSPRVRAQLRRDGLSVSKKTVEASMARQGLSARPKKKKGLTSQNPAPAAPEDLLGRDFSADGIDQKQFGDFKEVKTAEGPVFSATVLDLCSRRMVGFATSDDYPTAELAKAAINTAVATRGGNIDGVIFHSDKGWVCQEFCVSGVI